MLFAFFAGSVMEGIENKSNYEQEMTDKVMVSLRNMFGNDIKDPEKVIVTNWNNDEFSHGTYSFNKLKAGRKSREQLAAPIWRKGLYITGEATSSKYFQTTLNNTALFFFHCRRIEDVLFPFLLFMASSLSH